MQNAVTPGAKAQDFNGDLTARLKPRPFKARSESVFCRSL